MIIDSHLHLTPINKYLNFKESMKKLIKEMRNNKINYALLIPDNLKKSKIGDLNTCLKLIKNKKNIFLLGTIEIRKEREKQIKKLEALFKKNKIKGIKTFPGHDPIYANDKRLNSVYELCAKYNYPVVIHTGENSKDSKLGKFNDPKYIIQIAKKFPNLKIVICHYFNPRIEYCYNLTKKYSNIYFDTSALAHKEVLEMSDEKILKKFLKKTILERPGRVIFGTDYDCEGCNINEHIELLKSLSLPKKIEKEVFYKNAIKIFRLKIK